MKKNKIVLFDIDYTLFDTALFRKKFQKSLAKVLNMDEKTLLEIQSGVIDQVRKEIGYFHPEEFSKLLAKKINQEDKKNIILDSIFSSENFKDNYYREVKSVLVELSKEVQIGIFSKGFSKFQLKKLYAIEYLFKKDHLNFSVDKHKSLPELFEKYKDYSLYIVDDALDVLFSAKKLNNEVFTVWVKRGFYADKQQPIEGFSPDAIIVDLNKLISIINSSK